MSVDNPANLARYTARDFNTLVDDVKLRIQSRYPDDYEDFQATTQGAMIIDMIAYAMMHLHWYVDRRSSEHFIDTMMELSSAARLARHVGYRLRPASAGSTFVSMTPSETKDFAYTVPVGFKLTGPDGLTIETTEEAIWAAMDASSQLVAVRESETYRFSVSATGAPSQVVRMSAADNESTYLVDKSAQVFVGGVQWSEVEFLDFGQEQSFEVDYHSSPPTIIFGNGVRGAVPAAGEPISVTYATTHAVEGNVNRVNQTLDALIVRSQAVEFTVEASSPLSGGMGPESLEEARKNIPAYSGTRNRAITKDDYETLSRTFSSPEYGAIATASAYVARTAEQDLETSSYLNSIIASVDEYQLAIAGNGTQLSEIQASVSTSGTSMVSSLSEQAVAVDSIVDKAATLMVNADTLAGQKTHIDRVKAGLDALLSTDGSTDFDVDGLITILTTAGATAAADDLTNKWKPLLESMSSLAQQASSTLSTATGTVRSEAGELAVLAGDVSTAVSTDLPNQVLSVLSNMTSQSVVVTDLGAVISTHTESIADSVQLTKEHLTSFLGADGQANLITIPVLSLDSDGAYAEPSVPLMLELEEYLQERADVVHVVNVVSGSQSLIGVGFTVKLKQSSDTIFSTVASKVNRAVLDLMKRRDFGVSLILNKPYKLIEAITGTSDFVLSVTAPDGYLDAEGNVICPAEKVLVAGEVSVLPLS